MVNALLEEAAKFYEINQFAKALKLLTAAEVFVEDSNSLEMQELYSQVENFKGNCFLAGGDVEAAQGCFENAVSLNPMFSQAYISLGSIYWGQGMHDKALLNWDMGYNLSPDDQSVIWSYGIVLSETGQIDKAVDVYKKYLRNHPDDMQIISELVEISDIEELRNQEIDTELVIVTGISGSGKTTYSNHSAFPAVHIDHYFDYQTKKMDFDGLEKMFGYHLFLTDKTPEKIYLDGFIFNADETLNKLNNAIRPIKKISVKYIYTKSEELLASQKSTEERRMLIGSMPLSDLEYIRWSKKHQHFLKVRMDDLLADKKISGLEFIFREGPDHTKTSAEDFLKTIGEEQYWKMNEWELMTFVKSNEGQAYQTIEIDGKIIRPGEERCWLSWENISKLNIDWKDKYVCDVGSYFAYFSLQMLKSGAKKILGIDRKEMQLKVYMEVLRANDFLNVDTKCILLGNGNNIPDDKYDIVVALNMLHHVERATTPEYYSQVLDSVFKNTKETLFEINDYQVDQIKSYAAKFGFKLKGEIISHRNTGFGQRYIFHFVKE